MRVLVPCLLSLLLGSAAVAGEGEAFQINFGIGGSWYNPDTSGQGWIFEVVPAFEPPVMVAYNFAFPPELNQKGGPMGGGPMPGGMRFSGNQMWLVGAGEIAGDSVTIDVQRPFGGRYDMPMEPLIDDWGTITFVFHDCFNATVLYDSPFDDVTGEYDIIRLTPDVLCESGGAPAK